MPDITMCTNEECKLDCYRRLAIPSQYKQSYAKFEINEKGICNFYYKP